MIKQTWEDMMFDTESLCTDLRTFDFMTINQGCFITTHELYFRDRGGKIRQLPGTFLHAERVIVQLLRELKTRCGCSACCHNAKAEDAEICGGCFNHAKWKWEGRY